MGSATSTERMFASWAPCVRFTCRLAPIALEVLALVATANDGLNASAPQLATENGLETFWVAPSVPLSVESVASGPQLVGLNRKLERLIATLRPFSRSGTPLKIVGSVLVAITRPVCGSTLIAARVTSVPRLNGPAAALIGIDSPKGEPPYGPVRKTGPLNG